MVKSVLIKLLDRPGSVQTEIRVGHVGVPRRIDNYAGLSVMSAILGGLFNSRLNMKLREEKGYTYGASASFDPRRGAGPFSARVAVNTEVTVPALVDLLAELNRIREAPVESSELAAARDFLAGVFPLRFETPGPVVGALGGVVVHGLPDDELATYRARKTVDKYAYLAKREKIAENDFNLNIPRYVDTFKAEEAVDIAAVNKEIAGLEAELVKVRAEMAGCLKELGL